MSCAIVFFRYLFIALHPYFHPSHRYHHPPSFDICSLRFSPTSIPPTDTTILLLSISVHCASPLLPSLPPIPPSSFFRYLFIALLLYFHPSHRYHHPPSFDICSLRFSPTSIPPTDTTILLLSISVHCASPLLPSLPPIPPSSFFRHLFIALLPYFHPSRRYHHPPSFDICSLRFSSTSIPPTDTTILLLSISVHCASPLLPSLPPIPPSSFFRYLFIALLLYFHPSHRYHHPPSFDICSLRFSPTSIPPTDTTILLLSISVHCASPLLPSLPPIPPSSFFRYLFIALLLYFHPSRRYHHPPSFDICSLRFSPTSIPPADTTILLLSISVHCASPLLPSLPPIPPSSFFRYLFIALLPYFHPSRRYHHPPSFSLCLFLSHLFN